MLDSDPDIVGSTMATLTVRHVDEIEAVVKRHKVSIGVIATPAASAQAVCDRLVSAGVTSILNFAPLVLDVPDGVDVRKVDLSIELQILAFHAQRRSVVRHESRRPRGAGPRAVNGHPRTAAQELAGAELTARKLAAQAGGGHVSVLVVGLSHKSAPVAILERAVVSGDTLGKLLRDVAQAEPVAEVFVVSTCNRVEVYAEVDKFHARRDRDLRAAGPALRHPAHELTANLYVHYEDRAVSHLLAVTCGLDSMVVGEEADPRPGALGAAISPASRARWAVVLGELGRLALRTGKRARAQTGIDQAGAACSPWPSSWPRPAR